MTKRRPLALGLVALMAVSLTLAPGVAAKKPVADIESVTGITTIMTFGQKVTAIAVEYPAVVKPEPIEDPDNLDTYTVLDSWYDFRFDPVAKLDDLRPRTIVRMYTNDEPAAIPDGVSKPGRFVIVELSPLDYGGNTVRTAANTSYVMINPSPRTQVIQNRPVLTADGVVLGTPLGAESPTVYQPSTWLDPLADEFVYGDWCCQNSVDLPYYYHLPANYDPTHLYPMVVILPGYGMGYDGTNPKVNVVADIPATAWLQPAWTGSNEDVIVLAPQNRRVGPPNEAAAALKLMDEFMATHSVDPKRVYFSTVSWGSTTAWAMMQQRPGVFTAGLLTGGFAVSVAQATAIATARPLTPIYITHGLHDPLLRIASTGYPSRDRLRAAYAATGLVDADGAAALIPFVAYDTPSYFNQVVPQVPGYAEPDNHAVMGPTYADTSKLQWLLAQAKP
jgi:predicted peptidase